MEATLKTPTKKKPNPNNRNGRLQARFNQAEMRIVVNKMMLYTTTKKMSDYLRKAALEYEPARKTGK